MQSLAMKKAKITIISLVVFLLTSILIISGVGIYFKLTNKSHPELEVNPLDFSIDEWDGSVSAVDFNDDYAGRGTQTKTINSASAFAHFIKEVNNGNSFENYTIYLNSNLDFKGQTIPSISENFKGTFNGSYYTIMNVNIDGNALFEKTENATIQNLGLYNSNKGLINEAINTNIENVYIRFGKGNLVNSYVSNNGEHYIKNSFVDNETNGLINKLNTNNSSENKVLITDCYYTNGTSSIVERVGEVYLVQKNVIKPQSKNNFNLWSYSKDFSLAVQWCDYDYLDGSNNLDFNYPIQSGFVKVFLTGSFYESVMVAGNSIVNTSNLKEAFEFADEEQTAEINLLVEKIFMEARAEVTSAEVAINALKDTTIVRGENNKDSMFVSSGNSKITIGEEDVIAVASETNSRATITLDGNRKEIEENDLVSGALVVVNGGKLDIHDNVVLKDNINTNIKYGGAVLLYNTSEQATINATIENCSAEYGGGAIAAVGKLPKSVGTIRNCSTKGNGGAIYIASKLQNALSSGNIVGTSTTVVSESLNIAGALLENNISEEFGAAIYVEGEGRITFGTSEEERAYIKYNYGKGGAICYKNVSAIETIQYVNFAGNRQYTDDGLSGGAILIIGQSGEGEHIATFGEGCNFLDNHAYYNGGAIYTDSYDLNFTSTTNFTGNTANDNGAAIYALSNVILNNTTFTTNTSKENIVYVEGSLTVGENVYFRENECEKDLVFVSLQDNSLLKLNGGNLFNNELDGYELYIKNVDGTGTIEISKGCRVVDIYLENKINDPFTANEETKNLSFNIVETLTEDQTFNINMNNQDDYANTETSSPVLILNQGVVVDLTKFTSTGCLFVEGEQVDNKACAYLSIYEIKYVLLEGNFTTQKYNEGDLIVKIADPSREGYNFKGWFTEEQYENEFDLIEMPAKNVVVYAKWEVKKYNITFVVADDSAGYGAVDVQNIEAVYGDEVSFKQNVLTIGDDVIHAIPANETNQYVYKFLSWEGTIETIDENIVIIAHFTREINSHVVTIVVEPEDYGTVDIQSVEVEYGTSISALNNILTIGDKNVTATENQKTAQFSYSFVDWTGVPDNNLVEQPITITANFSREINKYKVVFNPNGGETAETERYVGYGAPYGELPIATKVGFEFKGWFTSATDGTQVTADTLMETANEHTLYAQWATELYTLTYNLNYGNYKEQHHYEYDEDIQVIEDPIREGYTFTGWYEEANCETLITLTKMPANDLEIYAGWSINSYTLTFNLNYENSEKIEKIFKYAEEIEMIENPTREEYSFIGWYDEANCENQFTLTYMPARDVEVFASWDIKKYSIMATSGDNGTISPLGKSVKEHGDEQLYIFVPDEGYHVSEILIDGNALSATDLQDAAQYGYKFTNIVADHTIHVEFAINTYVITASADGNGTISPNGEIIKEYNTQQTYTFEASVGYEVDTILIDGTALENNELLDAIDNGYVFKNITSDHTIEVRFKVSSFTITYVLDNGETNVVQTYDYQADIILPEEPKKIGHIFDGWFNEDSFETEFALTKMPAEDIVVYAAWKLNSYTITFDYNDGATEKLVQTYDYNTSIAYPPNPTRSGFKFGGWYKDLSYTNEFVEIQMPAEDVYVYAKWLQNAFEITFDLNYPTADENPTKIFDAGETVILATNPEREGYSLLGWYLEPECETEFDYIMPAQDITVYAKWEINSYTLTFNLNYEGSTNQEQIYEYNQVIILIANPTRDGYTFDGWYNEEGCETKFELSTMPAKDVEVFAKWEVNTYKLTFNYNDNETTNKVENLKYLEQIVLPEEPTRTGYTFKGWYNEEDGLTEFALTTMPNFDVVVYAKWEINSYTLTYDLGYENLTQEETYNYLEEIHLIDSLVREGYTFAGWYEDAGFETQFTSNIMPAQDIVIFAKWDINSYSITFNVGYAGGVNEVIDFEYLTEIKLPENPSRLGYSFEGWYNEIECETKFDLVEMPARDIEVFALWTINSYTITFNLNYANCTNIEQTFVFEQEIVLPENPTRDGYTFDGWYNEADCKTVFSTQFMPATNVMVYAKWITNKYNMIFNLNYDGLIDEKQFDFGTAIEMIAEPVRNGYNFVGWFEEESCENQFTLTRMPARDVEVFACWEIKTFVITATSGTNGSINPNGSTDVVFGTEQTYVFTPDEGYHVGEILIDGNPLSATDLQNSTQYGYKFTNVDADHTIHVEFAINTYKITATSAGFGTLEPLGVNMYDYGANATFSITPYLGYSIKYIKIDGEILNEDYSNILQTGYTFENIRQEHTIHVEFSSSIHTITVTSEGNGVVSPNGIVEVSYGDNKTFVFTPDEGHFVSSIVLNGINLSGSTLENAIDYGLSLESIDANHTIHVVFEAKTYSIQIKTYGKGSVSCDEDITSVKHGENRTFKINADTDKFGVEVYVNNQQIHLSGNTFTVENITQNITIEVKFTEKTFFETKTGIAIIIIAGVVVILIAISIPIIAKIRRNRSYRIIK